MSTVPTTPWPPGPVGKQRSPLAVVLLTLVTIGIYGLYWYYKTFQEIKDYSGQGLGGLLGLLLSIFCGIVTIFVLPGEVASLYERRGQKPPLSALTGFWVFLPFVGGIVWFRWLGRHSSFDEGRQRALHPPERSAA